MHRSLLIGAFGLLLLVSLGCGRGKDAPKAAAPQTNPLAELKLPPDTPERQRDVQAVVAGNNRFALDLFGKLRAEKGNIFLSPLSISTALAMTSAGAAGDTATEMRKVLHLDVPPERLHPAFATLLYQTAGPGKPAGYNLSIANALFGQSGLHFQRPFLDTLKASYAAALNQVDFQQPAAARKAINDWAAHHTGDRIKDAYQADDAAADTQLVLVNAIYFRGTWLEPFDKRDTWREHFRRSASDQVEVRMMHQTHPFRYAAAENVELLELPYERDNARMLILLPREVDGLAALEKELTFEAIEKWKSKLSRRPVELSLPHFTLRSQLTLNEPLVQLGMGRAFDPARADFNGIATEPLVISRVHHKALVEVDEAGTVAAAVTEVEMKKSEEKMGEGLVNFRADHPFLFVIYDTKTGSILFLGRVVDPQ